MHSLNRAGALFLLLIAGRLNAQEAAVAAINLKSGRVPPNQLAAGEQAAAAQRFSGNSRRLSGAPGRFHFLLQFKTTPGFGERAVLEQRGAAVLSYVPENTWICALPEGFDWSGLELAYAGELSPENRLSPLLSFRPDAPTAALIEFHADVAAGDARALLLSLGMELIDHPDLAPGSLLARGDEAAFFALAEYDEVAYVLPASGELQDRQPAAACLGGAQDDVPAAANLASRFGEGWDGPGLGQAQLKYWLGAMAPNLDAAATRGEILRALKEWTAAAAVQFTAVTSASQTRSIDIWFAQRDHGDSFRFDGSGGVLAHTFYPPPNAEPIAGNMHLDIEEPWRVGLDIDVFSVTLHELGHALGLGHNDDPNSVMYPYYRRVSGLRPADITEARKLYAAPSGSAAPPSTPTSPSTPATPGAPVPPAPAPPTPPSAPPVKDTTAPALSITSPASSTSTTTASSIVVRGVATDNVGVAGVIWQSGSSSYGSATGLPQFATPPIALNKGLNRITIRARDAAGNEAYRTLSITRR